MDWMKLLNRGSPMTQISLVRPRQGKRKFPGIECVKIVDFFADAYGMDWQSKLVGQRNQNAAFRRAIQFGHDQP